MTSSSMKFSAAGWQVGWITQISRARTFSTISTVTSPSLNRPTLALPIGTPRCRATAWASSGLAFPVKIINDGVLNDPLPLRILEGMAGTAGLEPANAGIKTPCLNQLGDVPVVCFYGFGPARARSNAPDAADYSDSSGAARTEPVRTFIDSVTGTTIQSAPRECDTADSALRSAPASARHSPAGPRTAGTPASSRPR